jgi:hypothetical protein
MMATLPTDATDATDELLTPLFLNVRQCTNKSRFPKSQQQQRMDWQTKTSRKRFYKKGLFYTPLFSTTPPTSGYISPIHIINVVFLCRLKLELWGWEFSALGTNFGLGTCG